MKNGLIKSLLVVVCVVGMLPAISMAQELPAKKVSDPIKKIERLTVERLPKSAVRIQEQSTMENRRNTAIKAEQVIREGGVTSDKMIVAMLANAWHESRWNPRDATGSCIGLFQIHLRHMGRGSSREQLMSTEYNTRKIMSTKDFKAWAAWCKKNSTASCGNMALRFAATVERCAVKHRYPRSVTADKWYKSLNPR